MTFDYQILLLSITDRRSYEDPESPRDDVLIADGFTFSEKSIRAGFIRRVYSILSVSGHVNKLKKKLKNIYFDQFFQDPTSVYIWHR